MDSHTYYNVKITDLLSVASLDPNHQFLIANPLVDLNGTIDSTTPYTSNKISGKTLSSTINQCIVNYISKNDMTVNSKWKFDSVEGGAKENLKLKTDTLMEWLEDDEKRRSMANDNGETEPYSTLTTNVFNDAWEDANPTRVVDSLSIDNDSLATLDFTHRAIAGAYDSLHDSLSSTTGKLSVTIAKNRDNIEYLNKTIGSFKSTIINTSADFTRYAEIWYGAGKTVGNTIAAINKDTIGVGVDNENVKQKYWNQSNATTSQSCIMLDRKLSNDFTKLLTDSRFLPGSVASDGVNFFYKTSQDCTIFIRMKEDYSNFGGEIMAAYLIYNTNGDSSSFRATLIGKIVEAYSGDGSQNVIALPVKKGTILMFSIFMRGPMPCDNAHKWQSAYYPGSFKDIGIRGALKDLYTKPYMLLERTVNINDYTSLSVYTRQLYADGRNIADIVSNGGTYNTVAKLNELFKDGVTDRRKKTFRNNSRVNAVGGKFGKIVDILELSHEDSNSGSSLPSEYDGDDIKKN